jgi:HAD superfamily hydrolase (TIGR01509 family)
MRPVVFDCDGVLVDSEHLSERSWRQALSVYDVVLTEDDWHAGLGLTYRETYEIYVQSYELPEISVFGNELAEITKRVLSKHLNAFQDAVDVLEVISGRTKLAVASSSSRYRLDVSLQTTKLDRFFEASVAGDEVQFGKPAPDLFLAAAEALGVDPTTCVAVEDTPAGIASAKAAGMTVVAVERGMFPASALAEADSIVPRLTPICVML